MTKDYSLTALRMGYLLANYQICEAVQKVLPPWNVNGLAQKAAEVAVKDRYYLVKTKDYVREIKLYVEEELKKMSVTYVPSDANFLILKINKVKDLKNKLLYQTNSSLQLSFSV